MGGVNATFVALFVILSIWCFDNVSVSGEVDLKNIRHYERIEVYPQNDVGKGTRRKRRSIWTLDPSENDHLKDAEFSFKGRECCEDDE